MFSVLNGKLDKDIKQLSDILTDQAQFTRCKQQLTLVDRFLRFIMKNKLCQTEMRFEIENTYLFCPGCCLDKIP